MFELACSALGQFRKHACTLAAAWLKMWQNTSSGMFLAYPSIYTQQELNWNVRMLTFAARNHTIANAIEGETLRNTPASQRETCSQTSSELWSSGSTDLRAHAHVHLHVHCFTRHHPSIHNGNPKPHPHAQRACLKNEVKHALSVDIASRVVF